MEQPFGHLCHYAPTKKNKSNPEPRTFSAVCLDVKALLTAVDNKVVLVEASVVATSKSVNKVFAVLYRAMGTYGSAILDSHHHQLVSVVIG